MKKWKEKWAVFSSLKKLLICLAAFVPIALLLYIAAGSPAFNTQMAFRRQEKAYMVGPGNIIAQFRQKASFYEDVIIAETEDSYMLCALRPKIPYTNLFYTYPKTDSMALYHLPGAHAMSNSINGDVPLTLILFDQKPTAVRAELEMNCPHPTNESLTVHLSAEASRQYGKFFLFEFYTNEAYGIMESVFDNLQDACRYYGHYDQIVTVRLYDRQNQLLSENTFLAGPQLVPNE